MRSSHVTFALTVLLALSCTMPINCIQSNSSCAPMPDDKRQLVCLCGKQLNLKCVFNLDIRNVGPAHLDRTLNPIKANEVSISRSVDPYDPYDPNTDFQASLSNPKSNQLYLYFPDFNVFSAPYTRVTFQRFIFVPSFAFKKQTSSLAEFRKLSSLVFEVSHAFDFGIDKFAFFGVESESLLIEGPFNKITVHKDSFLNSRIDELVIGCYCLDCESFVGDCVVNFGQTSERQTFPTSPRIEKEATESTFRRMKFFGVKLGEDSSVWNLDELPNVHTLEYLEINNLASIQSSPSQFELKRSQTLPQLHELHLKNNQIAHLTDRLLSIFSNLRTLNMGHNNMKLIDDLAFKSNPMIQILNLERNQITKMSKRLFSTLPNLKFLNLKENQLSHLERNSFENMKYLEIFDLTRNKLTTLDADTFTGLHGLKELLLSYNPLKSIDPHTFRWIGLNAVNLNRVDMISNYERDWFIFDDEDLCLLSHFRCGVKVNIDVDQRCNCFVKFLNEIAGRQFQVESNDPENAWFQQPCIETKQEYSSEVNLNSETDLDSDYIMDHTYYVHNRDPALFQTNAIETNPIEASLKGSYQTCSKAKLKLCYTARNSSTDQSCLYQKFLETKRLDINPAKELGEKLNENMLYHQPENVQQELVREKTIIGSDKTLTYLCLAVLVVFCMASISLILTLVLVVRRNSFVYYTAAKDSSNYPIDER